MVKKQISKLNARNAWIVSKMKKHVIELEGNFNAITNLLKENHKAELVPTVLKKISADTHEARMFVLDGPGGKKVVETPEHKRNLFLRLMAKEASLYTEEELITRWNVGVKHSHYGLILNRKKFQSLPPSIQEGKYREVPVRTKDNKKVYALMAWADWISRERQEPGNFKFLIPVLQRRGYILKAV